MKTKYNNKFSTTDNRTDQHGSYIQNFLEDEIDFLLAPSVNQISRVPFEKIFIANEAIEDIEKELKKYTRHSRKDKTCIIEGLTGSGKTMLVRHVFGVHRQVVDIKENSLIIPFSFDSTLYSNVSNTFVRMVHAACDRLTSNFPRLVHVDNDSESFYAFIESNRQDLLYFSDKYPSPSKIEQLQALLESKPLAFYCCALKYYLSQVDRCTIDNVIVVVDDIEGIRLEDDDKRDIQHELLPIKMVLELIECLQHRGENITHWSLSTVICCRHYVSRMMRTLPFSLDNATSYSQKLESYATCERHDLNNPPPIMDIIRKRYDAICAIESDHSEKWTTAMQVVMELLERVDNRISEFILNLTLGNIREAMKWIKRLVLNRRWIQRDCATKHPGAFEISDLKQFNVTPAALIRSIGMNEGYVYNSTESVIPNLLQNEPDSEMDLFPLLTLKHFLERSQYNEMSWDASIRVSHFEESVSRLFQSETYSIYFKKSLHYLLSSRLLLRSYDQDQTDNHALSKEDLDEIECVYVAKLAPDLWARLGQTSVFLEMFMDDIWLADERREKERQEYRGFDVVNFEVCLNYMPKLIEDEKKIYSQAYNAQKKAGISNTRITFEKLFGGNPICVHLLNGFERSINAYYRQSNPVESVMVERWRAIIHRLRKDCDTIYIWK